MGTNQPARPPTGPPSRAARTVVIGLLIGFTVAAWIGDLFLAGLIPDHPAILLALNDRLRNYPLASPHMDPMAFYGIGLARLFAPYPLYFLIGRWYGDAAVRWAERRAPRFGALMRFVERTVSKAAYPMVAFVPLNAVSIFAGASPMSMTGFVVTKLAGSAVILMAARYASEVLFTPLTAFGEWIGQNRLLVFIVCSAAFGAMYWWTRMSGGRTEVGDLAHLEAELAEDPAT